MHSAVLNIEERKSSPYFEKFEAKGRDFYSFSLHAMGTKCSLLFKTERKEIAQEFYNFTNNWLLDFEFKYSRFIPDSLISEINNNAGIKPTKIDEHLSEILSLADWFNWSTQGYFDPTMFPIVQLWENAIKKNYEPTEAEIEKVKSLIGWQKIQRTEKNGESKIYLPEKGMSIELGGIGKEYAVDCVFTKAQQMGINDILLNFGQDIRVHGRDPSGNAWRIGLENPSEVGKSWAGVKLTNYAVASSGTYFKNFKVNNKLYGHIYDIKNGKPIEHMLHNLSVIAPSCTEAGIFSTIAFILGKEKGLEMLERQANVEGAFFGHGRYAITKGFDKFLNKKIYI